MPQFRTAFYRTKGKEGLYDNDPDDPGGETVMGLTRAAEPSWAGWAVVDAKKKQANFPENLNCEEILGLAEAHYKAKYWDPLFLDGCESQKIANELFDTGVNIGLRTGARFLQLALNALNKEQEIFADLKVDGECGTTTIAAVNKVLAKPQGEEVLWKCLNGWQVVYYHLGKDVFKDLVLKLSEMPPPEKREKYMWGWIINRTFEAQS
jgi:lysozyme family protein